MGIGTSIFLIALGAILYFAVNADISGLEISTIGLILMIVGILGLIISLYYASIATRRTREVPADGRSPASATSTKRRPARRAAAPPRAPRGRVGRRAVRHLPPLGEVARADHERDAHELSCGPHARPRRSVRRNVPTT